MRARLVLGGVGVLVGLYGAWLLLTRQDSEQLTSAAIWVVSGIVLHDLVLAPLVVVLVYVGARVVPAAARAPAVAGLVVLGTVTVLSVPVLGAFGRRPDNPTLLDRDYWAGWLALAGLVLLVVVVASLVRSRRRSSGSRTV